ncbi:hypothetical protein [Desulfosoma sp.]
MNAPARWSLDELMVWQSWGRLTERLCHVVDPRGFVRPEDPETLKDLLPRLKACLDPESFELVLVSSLAAVLGQDPEAPAAARIALLASLLTDAADIVPWAPEKLVEAVWTLVPVLADARPHACAVWFAVGIHERVGAVESPPWWTSVADKQAQEAAAIAARLLRSRTGHGLLVLPVMSPSAAPSLYGPSLALPLYLAAWGLTRGRRPDRLAATGALKDDGGVAAVSGVFRKARAARALGCRGLLCPREGVDPEKSTGAAVALLPVKDVEAAEYLWETFEEQTGRNALTDFQRLSDPEELAHTLHLVDARAGRWHGFRARYRKTVEKIAQNPALTVQVLERLHKIVRDPHADPDWIERLLEPWDVSCLQALAEVHPSAAFQAAQIRWAAATRRGDPEEAAQWAGCCEALQPRVLLYPDGLDKVCDFLNRRLVSERHARYRFDPELPRDVQDMVRRLEEERRRRARNGRKPAAPALGKLYGTIAQNYGFCGPEHLEQVRRSVSAAQDAFGSGELPEYRAEWRRQFHYRLHAELDAEDREAAQRTVQAYLWTSRPDQRHGGPKNMPPHEWSPYEHAALARFSAETGAVDPAYAAWARHRLEKPFSGHPWPLWLWNMGRIFSTTDEKRRAWWQSAEHALRLGPTARPMALLGLAWLYREGLATASELEPYVARVVEGLVRGPLWRPHFESLLACTTTTAILDMTIRRAPTLFPFTYR